MRSSSQLVIDMQTSSFPSTTLPHVEPRKKKGAEKIEFGKSGRLSVGLQGRSQFPGGWRTGRRASFTCTAAARVPPLVVCCRSGVEFLSKCLRGRALGKVFVRSCGRRWCVAWAPRALVTRMPCRIVSDWRLLRSRILTVARHRGPGSLCQQTKVRLRSC